MDRQPERFFRSFNFELAEYLLSDDLDHAQKDKINAPTNAGFDPNKKLVSSAHICFQQRVRSEGRAFSGSVSLAVELKPESTNFLVAIASPSSYLCHLVSHQVSK